MKMLVLGSAGVFTVLMISAFVYLTTPERDSIFPQVVSCVNKKPDPPTSDRNWQPTLRVKVEPVRDPGRVREYRVLGCRLYYRWFVDVGEEARLRVGRA